MIFYLFVPLLLFPVVLINSLGAQTLLLLKQNFAVVGLTAVLPPN